MISRRLVDVISHYRSASSSNDLKIDSVLEDYLKSLFEAEDEDEFNSEEVLNLLKEHVPESNAIPRKAFIEWILETRTLLMGASGDKAEMPLKGGINALPDTSGERVNSLTVSSDSDHLAQLFSPVVIFRQLANIGHNIFSFQICEVREVASRARKTKNAADNDGRPGLTSGERLATMERYGFSSFSKPKSLLHPPEVTGTAYH
ncbi:unnamed protein product, partial [Hydatigera taeniaeformis]|uniref:Uncharacterized protein n=1 Tax=Hydatigena taeniaeformis TaxID=6205 RepID=A0A0R3WTQ7_HYDTA